MRLEISRKKEFIFSMYVASILVDGDRVARLRNGETVDVELSAGAQHLMVRTGPYVSERFDLSQASETQRLQIAPKSAFGAGSVVILGGAALALSRTLDTLVLLSLLGLAIFIDLTFMREKWGVSSIGDRKTTSSGAVRSVQADPIAYSKVACLNPRHNCR